MTQHKAHHGSHVENPEPIDPERDVDGFKTAAWLGVSAIVLAASIWLLFVLFDLLVASEKYHKVEAVESPELKELRETEKSALGASGNRPSIEQAIQDYVNKK